MQKTWFCPKIHRLVGSIVLLIKNCSWESRTCTPRGYKHSGEGRSSGKEWGIPRERTSPRVLMLITCIGTWQTMESEVQRVTRALGTQCPQQTFLRIDFTKSQMEYKLVVNTCPDVWKLAFLAGFLWNITMFFEPPESRSRGVSRQFDLLSWQLASLLPFCSRGPVPFFQHLCEFSLKVPSCCPCLLNLSPF